MDNGLNNYTGMKDKKYWTAEEVATLKRMFQDHLLKEIAEHIGRTKYAVAVKAYHLGLKKAQHPFKKNIPAGDILWLKLNFKHLTNDLLCMRLKISHSTLHRLARQYGLTKSPEFMKDTHAFTVKKAHESHIRNGTYPPKGVPHPNFAGSEKYQFKKGQYPLRWKNRKTET